MADVAGFRGLLYDPDAGSKARVTRGGRGGGRFNDFDHSVYETPFRGMPPEGQNGILTALLNSRRRRAEQTAAARARAAAVDADAARNLNDDFDAEGGALSAPIQRQPQNRGEWDSSTTVPRDLRKETSVFQGGGTDGANTDKTWRESLRQDDGATASKPRWKR